ncbi:hypothetical protein H0H92_011164, partial [Tricholoma furcatifolium]
MQCDLFVVPRVDLYPKRKRQEKGRGRAKQKGVKAPRIPQQRLDPKNLEDLGFEITRGLVMTHIETHLSHWAGPRPDVPSILMTGHDDNKLPLRQEFLFRGHGYSDGYAIISTTQHKPAIPTRAELNMFKDCKLIPSGEIVAMEQRIDALRLSVGDPVKITGGEVSGALGHIVDLSLDNSESMHHTSTATVETSDGVRLEVSFNHLRKILAVGDCVLIVDGVHQGFKGWIVCIEGEIVHLFDDASGEGVCVAAHQVMFYEPPKTKYTRTQPDLLQAPPGFHKSNLRAQDIIPPTSVSLPNTRQQNPHQRFVGRYIKVLKGPFKDYLGFVKNTEQGDLLNVELQATLQRRQFDLRNIAHVDDPELRPLIVYAKTIGSLPNFSSIQRVDEPAQLSSMPLVPSTPIPEDSSAAMGRAWNPSSHTPNPNSSY